MNTGIQKNQRARFERMLLDMDDGIGHSSDIAFFAIKCMAESADTAYYCDLPDELKAELREILGGYAKRGFCELVIPHVDIYYDISEDCRKVIHCLVEAGLLDQEYTEIAPISPLFVGLEHIQGGEILSTGLPQDRRICDVRIAAISRQVEFANHYPKFNQLSLEIHLFRIESEANTNAYRKILQQAWLMHLQMDRNLNFSGNFSLCYVDSIVIEPTPGSRTPRFDIRLIASAFEGTACCKKISLLAFEELKIEALS